MAILTPDLTEKPRIDLSGPMGNAYGLLGLADDYGKALDMDDAQREAIQADMRSGDYDHLIQVFDKHFGEHVDLILPPAPPAAQALPTARKRKP
jgi:hypothetical protein